MTNTGQIFNNNRKWHLNIIEHFIWGCTPQILFETRLQNRSRFQMDLQDLKYYVAWKLREFLISRMILYWFLGTNWRDVSDCGYFRRNRSRYNRFWRENDPRFSSFCRDGGCSSFQVALPRKQILGMWQLADDLLENTRRKWRSYIPIESLNFTRFHALRAWMHRRKSFVSLENL